MSGRRWPTSKRYPNMSADSDVLIIGAGAVGVCSAYYASKRGLKVTLIDKGEVCSGCSHGNSGLIVPSHVIPLAAPSALPTAFKWMFTPDGPIFLKLRFDSDLFSWLWQFRKACNKGHLRRAMPLLRELSLESARLFEGLAHIDGLSFGYQKKGYLKVCKTASGLKSCEEEVNLVRSVGVEARIVDSRAIRELEPNLRTDVLGGIFYPEDAHIVPGEFVRGLARQLEQQGVQIQPSAEVLDFEFSNNRITRVRTTRGYFRAKQIVLAVGSWIPDFIRSLGIRLLVLGAKGYSFTFKRPAICPSIPFSLAEAGVAASPMGEFLRITGTFALVGLDLSWNRKRMQSMLKQVTTYLPDLEPRKFELLEVWRGLRPCSPDGLPYLGRSRKYENLIVAAGHAMIGVSLSPITGTLVSQLLMGETPSIDLSPLAVHRFA